MMYCILCGSELTLIDHRHQRGYCPTCRRHVTAVTLKKWLARSAELVREALNR